MKNLKYKVIEKTIVAIVLILFIIIVSKAIVYGNNSGYAIKYSESTSFEDYSELVDRYAGYYGVSLEKYLDIEGEFKIDSEIVSKSLSLKEDTVEETINDVLNFVSNHIEYRLDNNSLRNYGNSIDPYYNKIGVCEDYARLSVSMLRANGIYAKYVVGGIFNETNKHAWIEVLYPISGKGLFWNPIDPQNNEFPKNYVENKPVLAEDIVEIQVFKHYSDGERFKYILDMYEVNYVSEAGVMTITIN